MEKNLKVPPDGGYGWMIVFAMALVNVVGIPIIQNFGLIFKDTFAALGLSATEGSLIINVNCAFGMLFGIFNGVLLKIFGYRKIAMLAACLLTGGIVLTSFASTFTHFMITYGLITSLGFALTMSAYGLALNSYFKINRSKAMGYTMTITGFGPIIMPQVINLLLTFHTIEGVTLILGAIVSHSFVSAALLQPIKWHMKNDSTSSVKDEELTLTKEVDNSRSVLLKSVSEVEDNSSRITDDEYDNNESKMGSMWSINPDVEAATIYGLDSALSGSILSLHSAAPFSRRTSTISGPPPINRRSTTNLNARHHSNKQLNHHQQSIDTKKPSDKAEKKVSICKNVAQIFDLDLMKDPIYVNIMLGMSLAVFAEMNFSVLTPFILNDFNLSTSQIATFLSVLGIADIAFRFFAPYIGEYLNKPPRPMYAISLLMLIATRFSLLLSNNFYVLLVMAAGLGVAKGVRTVYMSLVIPTYVPLEKLASAAGIQMMVNGICILIGGPILGVVRDKTGSYSMCIIIMNCVTLTTILMWTLEAIISRYFKRRSLTKQHAKELDNVLLNK